MANKARGLNTHVEHRRLIKEAIRLLKEGKLINENSLKVDRQKFKTMLVTIKGEHNMDVLTVNRGHRTIGWILASEVIYK